MSDEDPQDLESLIDEQAFRQIEVEVGLENLTSDTGVAGAQRTYGAEAIGAEIKTLSVKLMEFREGGVALDVPSKTGAIGHVVRVSFDVQGTKMPFSFSAKGTIEKIDVLDSEREKFVIRFLEFDPEYLSVLRTIFADRQAEIDQFLEQVHG